jgi:2-hydroxychromene-2-carboxylate isomerase
VAERVAGNCGLDGAALLIAASDPAIKQQLAADTAQAVTDGVFGVPTLRINDELFWGADRIEALELRLRGQQIDEARLAAFLARPPRARRTPR